MLTSIDPQAARAGRDIDVGPGDGHAVGISPFVKVLDESHLDGARGAGDINHAKAGPLVGDVGVTAGDGHAQCLSRCVDESHNGRVRWVRDLDYLQT